MLNASVGVQRVIGRVRRPTSQESTRVASTPHSQPGHLTRSATRWHRLICFCDPNAAGARSRCRPWPSRARSRSEPALGRLGHERTVAVAVAGIVLGASFLSVAPGRRRRATPAARPATDPRRASASAARSATTATRTAASKRTTPMRRPTKPRPQPPRRLHLRQARARGQRRSRASTISRAVDPAAAGRRLRPDRRGARSSTTARCSSPSRSTPRSPTAVA